MWKRTGLVGDNAALTVAISTLALQHGSFIYRRITAMLRCIGCTMTVTYRTDLRREAVLLVKLLDGRHLVSWTDPSAGVVIVTRLMMH